MNFPFDPQILTCSNKIQCSVIVKIEKPFSFMFCVLTSVLNQNFSSNSVFEFIKKNKMAFEAQGLGTVGI